MWCSVGSAAMARHSMDKAALEWLRLRHQPNQPAPVFKKGQQGQLYWRSPAGELRFYDVEVSAVDEGYVTVNEKRGKGGLETTLTPHEAHMYLLVSDLREVRVCLRGV